MIYRVYYLTGDRLLAKGENINYFAPVIKRFVQTPVQYCGNVMFCTDKIMLRTYELYRRKGNKLIYKERVSAKRYQEE